jgi:hypothetical protein
MPSDQAQSSIWPDLAVGEYADLVHDIIDARVGNDLVPFFIPSLGAVLLNVEQSKGNPLTEQEVTVIRDHCKCALLTAEIAAEMEEKRGYRDINPKNCWQEYLDLKAQMNDHKDA